MKKKMMGILLTTALILTSSVSAVYADPYGKGKLSGTPEVKKEDTKSKETNNASEKKDDSMSEEQVSQQEEKRDIEELREELKQVHKDKQERKELIRQIVEQRRANDDDSIPVFINGKELKSDVPPVIKYGRMLIPVRAVTNALGAEVQWNAETATATITKAVYDSAYGETTINIEIKLDAKIALVNGQEVELDANAETINNRMMVPIRFISETFKQYVEWDEESGCAIIEDEQEEEESDEEVTETQETEADPSDTSQSDNSPGTST